METQYCAVFHYDGKEPNSKYIKDALEKTFMLMYNIYCDATNPLLEVWNSAAECPNDCEKGVGSRYYQYIQEKEMEVVETVNQTWNNVKFGIIGSYIKEFFIGEECEFRARLSDGTEMFFTLKQV